MSALEAPPTLDEAGRRTPPSGPVTFEQFLEWADEDTHAEWVDGEVVLLMTATDMHQQAVSFLLTLMRTWIEQTGNGGLVLPAPFLMRPGAGLPAREPDLLYVAADHLASRLKRSHLDGPADLVVEVLSPESRSRDRNAKFFEYERGGVGEYWIVDPDSGDAEFYRRDDTGAFRRIAPDAAGVYTSAALPGFALDTDWLRRRPLPTLVSVLASWNLLPGATPPGGN
jgi:Uma2 family endonuclease